MRLLQEVQGITVLPLVDDDRCCGFGGTFSMKNPDISTAMAGDKARHVADTGAEFLVAGDNPVSYTHLDVYKRQPPRRSAPGRPR